MYRYRCLRECARAPSSLSVYMCASREMPVAVLLSKRFFTKAKASEGSGQDLYYDFSESGDEAYSWMMDYLRKKDPEQKKLTSESMSLPSTRYIKPSSDGKKVRVSQTRLDDKVVFFSKDIVNTYNLFTTCLRANDLARAEQLLSSFYTLIKFQSNKVPMVDALNSYFMKWTADSNVTVEELTTWFSEAMTKFKAINFDSRIYATLIDAVMSRSDPAEGKHKILVKMYKENCKKTDLRELLVYADSFRMENLKTLVNDLNVSKNDLPKDLRDFFQTEEEVNIQKEEEARRLAREFSFAKDELPELEKNSETLKSVDTFGLKVIRHSIMALASKNKSQVLADFATKLDAATPVDAADIDKTSTDVDFFSIYQSLSDQDKVLFDAALEEFNYERQLSIETSGLDSAKEKWKHDYEQLQKNNIVTTPNEMNHFLYKWQQELTKLIKEEVESCKKLLENPEDKTMSLGATREKLAYAPYITVVSPEKMAVITILELLKTNSAQHAHVVGLRTARVVLEVGNAIETEYNSQECLKSAEDKMQRQRLKKFFKTGSNKARRYLKRMKSDTGLADPALGWTHEVSAKLGSVLVSFLLQVAKISVKAIDPVTKEEVEGLVPAFHHSFQYVAGTKVGIIKKQPEFAARLSKDDLSAIITPQGLPMLVKPKPWASFNEGGYLTIRSLLARSKSSAEQVAYLRAASDNGQLQEIYEGLNVLGNTGWTVNKKVYKVVASVWNTGKAFLDVPGIIETPSYPEKPSRDSPPEVMRNWKQNVQKVSNEFGKARSLRCDTNYKLEIARAFLGEKFYFPHNLDFRGRAYPLSPHFNHLGNDLTRSLLMFWDGKELGQEGLNWLKVHLSNLFGIDKVSLADRIKFVDENIDNFEKCAKDPLSEEGNMWQKADKPWQALATIYEIVEALKLEDPTKYVSHQPVHQDGTCNGLQHYAALGGDVEGARQVNLVPQDKPADVYSYVAELVQKRVDQDVLAGVPEAIKVQKHIKRKVVKQTVMTNVYGVTFVGAREQISKQLDEIFTDRLELTHVSRYLTTQVFASIRELFEGAHLIQDWLVAAAKIISKSFYIYEDDSKRHPVKKPDFITSVVWTTPLGLPIVQPYRNVSRKQVKTNLQTVYIADPYMISPVDSKKQQNAFPANFVHSLDATHMLKSSTACGQANISFAAVHDSYWTHASDVPTMNKILRNEFVSLYQIDIIKELKEELERRYSDHVQVVPIALDHVLSTKLTAFKNKLSEIKKRKLTVYDELYLEVERRRMLNSDDPEEVERGKEFITTVSLMKDFDFSHTSTGSSIQVLAPFKLPEIPSKGDLDVDCVTESPYFFS